MSLGPILTVTEEDRHWWFASRTKALLGLLDGAVSRAAAGDEAAPPPGHGLVLDIGCGAGNMTHHLARYGRVVGIDSFRRPLAVARDRGYAVGQAPAESIPFADGTFDIVALLDVVEHCDDDGRVLREARRVMKARGLLAVTVPAFPFLWSENDSLNGHRRRYTPKGLREALTAGGFEIVRLTCNNLPILPMAAALNFVRKARGAGLGIAAPSVDEEAYQVEMQPTHPVLNAALGAVGALEARLLQWFSFPAGTGLIAIAAPRVPLGTLRI